MSTTVVAPVVVARAAAAAAVAVPGVVALHGGHVGELATYGAGARVPGVRLRADGVTIYVVAQYGRSLATIAAEVREVVAAACQAARPAEAAPVVDVHIADVRTDPVAIDAEV